MLGGATCSPLSLSTVKSTSVVCIRNSSRGLGLASSRERERNSRSRSSCVALGHQVRISRASLSPRAKRISLARPVLSSASLMIATTTATFCHTLFDFTLPLSVFYIYIYTICRVSEFLARLTDPGSWSWSRRDHRATSRSRKGYELETCCPLLFPLTYIKGSMTECYIRAKDVCQRLSDRERVRHAWVDRVFKRLYFSRERLLWWERRAIRACRYYMNFQRIAIGLTG